ncbi:aspartyl protease family protein [Caballeronia sp. KNU42]
MPITPGTFRYSKPYDPVDKRPYAEVYINNGGTTSSRIDCLVDTGSDYTILPAAVASKIGLATIGPNITVGTPSGSTFTLPSANLQITIEGFIINTQVLLTSAKKFTAIVGHHDLIKAFDIGFDITDWYWK